MRLPVRSSSASSGYSLAELLFAVAIAATASAAAIPQLVAGLDDMEALGAARYLASRLQRARMEAISRGANVGLRFAPDDVSVSYTVYADGNGNGLSNQDIQRGLDPEIEPAERLTDNFRGVDFGTLPDLPSVDGDAPPGSDPIRLGSSDMVSFSALGSSTSGSLYIRSNGNVQYVVRIFGETGRIRVLRFNAWNRSWVSV